ncbi:hypothetical protein BJX63DRAFT_303195 [Aspergillus granulosus]|uniref:Uncharacterized protein n=1 Tax=Aspergillus granulosus TaxID=176169 RepID=A0ABR4H615_9EURO
MLGSQPKLRSSLLFAAQQIPTSRAGKRRSEVSEPVLTTGFVTLKSAADKASNSASVSENASSLGISRRIALRPPPPRTSGFSDTSLLFGNLTTKQALAIQPDSRSTMSGGRHERKSPSPVGTDYTECSQTRARATCIVADEVPPQAPQHDHYQQSAAKHTSYSVTGTIRVKVHATGFQL